MNLYQKHIMPKFVNLACGGGQMKNIRRQCVPAAYGTVLEIGFGSGHNFPFYQSEKILKFYALDPDAGMRKLAKTRMQQANFSCDVLDLKAEEIPLESDSIDSLVMTFTLCTIADVSKALSEMHRVIKPGGVLIFAEHGLAPDAHIAKWQKRIEPIWKPLGGGCHLTRNPVKLLEENGFCLDQSTADYLPKAPKFAGYVNFGTARPSK